MISETAKKRRFESLALPHLNAAYNLARWLLRDEYTAQDAVQEAYFRAFKFFDSFKGNEIRPWLLGIVRNECWSHLRHDSYKQGHMEFDDELHSETHEHAGRNPEAALLAKAHSQEINNAIAALPSAYKETLILRELEELSYEEIAHISGIPIGTVMSRLARARSLLRVALSRGEK